MPALSSSMVASADYDPATQALVVVFKNGGRGVYEGVPPDVAGGLFDAPSAGSYLNDFIKPAYSYRRG